MKRCRRRAKRSWYEDADPVGEVSKMFGIPRLEAQRELDRLAKELAEAIDKDIIKQLYAIVPIKE